MVDSGQDETLRRLRREVEDTPSATAWSRLAQALARSGDELGAYEAASRALALDPSAETRSLLRPHWGCDRADDSANLSVAWRGLRQLAGARTVGSPPGPRPFSPTLDAGQAVAVYDDVQGISRAIDVFSGAELWTRPRSSSEALVVAGTALHRVTCPDPRSFSVELVEARTGRALEARAIARASAMPHSPDDLRVVALDAGTLAFLLQEPEADPGLRRGLRTPRNEVLVHDLASGATLAEIELPASSMLSVRTASGTLLASAEDRRFLAAFDRTGKKLWEEEAEGTLLGVADGKLFLGAPGRPWHLGIRDARSGRRIDERPLPGKPDRLLGTADILVITAASGELVLGLDRKTLAPRYERPLPGRGDFVATADALLWLRPTPRSRTVGDVIALDPASCDELSRFPVGALQALPVPLLVGGRLLLPCHGKMGAFVAVEGP